MNWLLSVLTHWPPLMERHWSSLATDPRMFTASFHLWRLPATCTTWRRLPFIPYDWVPLTSHPLQAPIPSHWPPPVHPSLNANIHLSTIDLPPSQIIHIHSLPLTACQLLPSSYLTPTSNKFNSTSQPFQTQRSVFNQDGCAAKKDCNYTR